VYSNFTRRQSQTQHDTRQIIYMNENIKDMTKILENYAAEIVMLTLVIVITVYFN